MNRINHQNNRVRKCLLLALAAGTLALNSCSDEEASRGFIGAVGGAAAGSLLGGDSDSAAAGAIIGGLMGAGTAQNRGPGYGRGYYNHGYYPPPPPRNAYHYPYRY